MFIEKEKRADDCPSLYKIVQREITTERGNSICKNGGRGSYHNGKRV